MSHVYLGHFRFILYAKKQIVYSSSNGILIFSFYCKFFFTQISEHTDEMKLLYERKAGGLMLLEYCFYIRTKYERLIYFRNTLNSRSKWKPFVVGH